jgi:hypothetical protein
MILLLPLDLRLTQNPLSTSKTLWDLDNFASSTTPTPPRSTTLHFLDDNDHDNLMGGIGNHEEEEAILGMLSKPLEVVIAKKVFPFLLPHHRFFFFILAMRIMR